MHKTRQLTLLSLFTSIGIILHVVEALLPAPITIPGAKLGFANVVTLLALGLLGFRQGLAVAFLRTFLGSMISGTFLTTSYFLSASGALMSTIAMGLVILIFKRQFSMLGISVVGSVVHNLTQLMVASFIIENTGIFFYLPYLLLISLPTGILTGMVASILQAKLECYKELK